MIYPLLDDQTLASLQGLENGEEDSFLCELISVYAKTGAEIIEAMRPAVSTQQIEKLMHLAHKLKGMSLNVGAKAVFHLAETTENLTKEGEFSQISPLLPKLQQTFDETCTELSIRWKCQI